MDSKIINRPVFFYGFIAVFFLFPFSGVHGQGVKTVVLDAGHGGHDPGNLGTRRYKKSEKDISLDVVLKIGEYIKEEFPDVKVIYTRKDDRFVQLHERAGIANRNNADLFISIHCNYAKSPEAYGTETWVMGLHRSKDNLEVAMRENSVILQEDNYQNSYADFDPRNPDSYIAMSLMQSAYFDQSLTLAAKVQEDFANKVGRKNRGVKQAGLLVLYKSAMPAILVELGFLTNRQEEDFLHSDEGKTYMASSVFRAFKAYKQIVESVNVMEDQKQVKEHTKPKEKNRKEILYKPVENQQDTLVVEEVPINESTADPVVFKVQLLSSDQKIALQSPRFKGEKNIEELRLKGSFKYTTGNFKKYNEARAGLDELKKKFPSAFIVAFRNSEPIAVQEAIKLTQNKQNSEIQ